MTAVAKNEKEFGFTKLPGLLGLALLCLDSRIRLSALGVEPTAWLAAEEHG